MRADLSDNWRFFHCCINKILLCGGQEGSYVSELTIRQMDRVVEKSKILMLNLGTGISLAILSRDCLFFPSRYALFLLQNVLIVYLKLLHSGTRQVNVQIICQVDAKCSLSPFPKTSSQVARTQPAIRVYPQTRFLQLCYSCWSNMVIYVCIRTVLGV